MIKKTEQYETCGFNWPFYHIKTRLRIFKPLFGTDPNWIFGKNEKPNSEEAQMIKPVKQDKG